MGAMTPLSVTKKKKMDVVEKVNGGGKIL